MANFVGLTQAELARKLSEARNNRPAGHKLYVPAYRVVMAQALDGRLSLSNATRQMSQELRKSNGRQLRRKARKFYRHQLRTQRALLRLIWATDFSVEYNFRLKNASIPHWILERPEFQAGESPDATWAELYLKDAGPDALFSLFWTAAAELENQLHNNEDAGAIDYKIHKIPDYFGREIYPTQAIKSHIRMAHISAHPHWSGDAGSWEAIHGDMDEGNNFEPLSSYHSNGDDLGDLIDAGEVTEGLQEWNKLAAEFGLDFIVDIEVSGRKMTIIDQAHRQQFERRLDLLHRIAAGAEGPEGLSALEKVMKRLDLTTANLQSTVESIAANFAGKWRTGSGKNLGQIAADELSGIYQEELERARQGLELTIMGDKWLEPGQKAGLSKIRNRTLRERAGKK